MQNIPTVRTNWWWRGRVSARRLAFVVKAMGESWSRPLGVTQLHISEPYLKWLEFSKRVTTNVCDSRDITEGAQQQVIMASKNPRHPFRPPPTARTLFMILMTSESEKGIIALYSQCWQSEQTVAWYPMSLYFISFPTSRFHREKTEKSQSILLELGCQPLCLPLCSSVSHFSMLLFVFHVLFPHSVAVWAQELLEMLVELILLVSTLYSSKDVWVEVGRCLRTNKLPIVCGGWARLLRFTAWSSGVSLWYRP